MTSLLRPRSHLMHWSGAVLAIALLDGCGQYTFTAAGSPSPSLPCRMPSNLRVDQGGFREVLGYLGLPSGTTTDDPSDAIVKVADFPAGGGATVPVWGTLKQPQLIGVALGTYSSVAGRWLPAPPELVSPDGLHYAYLGANGTLRLATAEGAEISVPNPNQLTPLAYTDSGVVLVQPGPASNGLWLLDPTSQSVTAITPPAGTDDWREVSSTLASSKASGGTFAFGLDSPGVLGAPPPTTVLIAFLGSSVLKLKTVYTADFGNSIALIASDWQGGLLIAVTGASPGLVYLDPATGPRPVAAPPGVVLATIGPRHHADAHGIWFVGRTGIFLFNATSGLQKIAAGVTTDVAPGGDCT